MVIITISNLVTFYRNKKILGWVLSLVIVMIIPFMLDTEGRNSFDSILKYNNEDQYFVYFKELYFTCND